MIRSEVIKKATRFHSDVRAILFAVLSSLAILSLSTGLKVLSPHSAGWLSIEDGRAEISWEFYRRTSFPKWLYGDLGLYGMEASSPLYYSTLPPAFALILRPFSNFLPERFQFFGIMLFLNLTLIYFIAYKIFSFLSINFTSSNLGSVLIVLSPLTLHRYIDHSHYTLTANWLILLAFYLVYKNQKSPYVWSFFMAFSIMIFAYYTFMIFIIYFIWMIIEIIKDRKNTQIFFSTLFFSVVTTTSGLFLSGFFTDIYSARASGYGFYKSNLLSIFDPNGWSYLIPSVKKSPGDYEGFSYPGISFLIILTIIALLILINKFSFFSTLKRSNAILNSLWLSALLLFILSLSNKVEIFGKTIFAISYPNVFENAMSAFRSTGRFTWVVAYLIMITSFIFFVHLINSFKPQVTSIILILLCSIQFVDVYSKLISERDNKFSLINTNFLTSSFWKNASDCYEAFNSVPAHKFSSHAYNLAEIAGANKIGVYPAFTARDSEEDVEKMILQTRDLIKFGEFNTNRIYVFQPKSTIADTSAMELDKKIVLNRMSSESRAGYIDDLFVFAPDIRKCNNPIKFYSNNLVIEKNNSFKVNSREVEFGINKLGNNLLLEGWSPAEKWGIWTVSERANLMIQTPNEDLSEITLIGNLHKHRDQNFVDLEVRIDGESVKYQILELENDTQIKIPLENIVNNRVLFIDLLFSGLKSPLSEGVSPDPRPLGFGLKKLVLSD